MKSSSSSAAEITVTVTEEWSRLSWDLTELILSYLPLRDLAVARAVCRLWNSVLSQPSFPSRRRQPWLFLHGVNHVLPSRNQSFAFDPDSSVWFSLRIPSSGPAADILPGSGGYAFATSPSYSILLYSPLLNSSSWRFAPPLPSPRSNPLIAVLGSQRNPKFLAIGGVRYVGGLVDIEADRLATELFDPSLPGAGWQLYPPLPPEFRSASSSQWLTAASIHQRSRQFLFVAGIYSGIIACLDLSACLWGPVRTLRPAGVLFSFLLAAGDRLVLAGLRSFPGTAAELVLWDVNHVTMSCTEMGIMPGNMLASLFDGENDYTDENRFAGLKCIGVDGLVYVVNEDPHKNYPACLCMIDGRKCRWRKLPELPGPVNRLHKVVAFCSHVPLSSVLGGDEL